LKRINNYFLLRRTLQNNREFKTALKDICFGEQRHTVILMFENHSLEKKACTCYAKPYLNNYFEVVYV